MGSASRTYARSSRSSRRSSRSARLIELVPGWSETTWRDWLDERGQRFREGIEITASDSFQGYRRTIDEHLEIATAEYIDRFNHRRLHDGIGMIPPVELEDIYHHHQTVPAPADAALASL